MNGKFTSHQGSQFLHSLRVRTIDMLLDGSRREKEPVRLDCRTESPERQVKKKKKKLRQSVEKESRLKYLEEPV